MKSKEASEYKNTAIALDIVVFGYNEGKLSVLLLNRKEEPYKNCWTLPGAFLHMEETFQQCCARILLTKLGMNDVYLEQLYSFDNIERDPRGRVLSVTYYALVNPSKFELAAGQMANDVQWFDTNELPRLGFDHNTIFKVALQRLQAKIQYHPAGFELLDELFTMTELQALYECILGIMLDRRNFRRKILDEDIVLNTGKRREGLKSRPAELYSFNKKLRNHIFNLNIS